MYNGSVLGQIGDRIVNLVKAEQFGITTPPTKYESYYREVEKGVFKKITNDFFTKDKTVRYWAVQTVGEIFEGSIRGMTDDGSQYHYEIIE